MGLFSGLLDILYPPRCAFCRRITEKSRICGECVNKLPYCSGGARTKGEFFREYTAVFQYSGLVRESLLRYKFNERREYAKVYAPLLKERIEKDLGSFDIITWVPISKKRYRERGYDQAELLARETADLFGKEAKSTLTKILNNSPQSGLRGREKRAANVMGVYEVHNEEAVKEKTILLLDDIITTGSTLSECARTLLMAGAEEIICAVVAEAD